jgi:hypothetical protein
MDKVLADVNEIETNLKMQALVYSIKGGKKEESD